MVSSSGLVMFVRVRGLMRACAAIVDESERCVHLRKTFASMPERHRDCLEFLMFHLHRVAHREPENLV